MSACKYVPTCLFLGGGVTYIAWCYTLTLSLSEGLHLLVCVLYNVVIESHSVQNSNLGGGGSIASSRPASSHVADFNTRNKLLTQKLLKQGYLYYKLRKHFLNFIDDTMIWYLIAKFDLHLSCSKDFPNLNSIVSWCINLRRLLALIIFQHSSLK